MSVYKAICAVQLDLSKAGISKDSTNTFDGYKFRGIDAVYNALSPLLAKHGLCILPRVLSRHLDERVSKKGDPVFYVTVEVEFDFVCSEDGSKHTVKTFGEAMDRGDKATNKAMSAAYKYAAFQAFAIPTEGDNDADASTPDIAVKEPNPASGAGIKKEAYDTLLPEDKAWVDNLAVEITTICQDSGAVKAIEEIKNAFGENTDQQFKLALWWKLDSKTRSAIDAIQKGLKK